MKESNRRQKTRGGGVKANGEKTTRSLGRKPTKPPKRIIHSPLFLSFSLLSVVLYFPWSIDNNEVKKKSLKRTNFLSLSLSFPIADVLISSLALFSSLARALPSNTHEEEDEHHRKRKRGDQEEQEDDEEKQRGKGGGEGGGGLDLVVVEDPLDGLGASSAPQLAIDVIIGRLLLLLTARDHRE